MARSVWSAFRLAGAFDLLPCPKAGARPTRSKRLARPQPTAKSFSSCAIFTESTAKAQRRKDRLMDSTLTVMTLSAGLVVAGLAIWFFVRWKIASAVTATKESQIAGLQAELRQAQDESRRLVSQLQAEGAIRAAAEEKSSRIPEVEAELNSWQRACGEQREQNAKLAAELRSLEERFVTERQQLETIQQKFQR